MRFLSLKIVLLAAALWLPCTAHAANNILVFGDSLSAGYGIPAEKSWPVLLQEELQRTHPKYRVVNASISGETTLGGRQRIVRALQQHRPAVVVLALGANDGLRGLDLASAETNLGEIIQLAKEARARVLLVGMRLPPNYGASYIAQFEDMYTELAKRHRVQLLPFLLEGVAPEQFQPDNLHPTAKAQPHIMQSVLKQLRPLLR
ncbi:MAG: arylesterase [Gallionellales bacterium GWA2_60_18]|nr:MAG: arylesterase [Gallionellales bacterium GWA2_60_18]